QTLRVVVQMGVIVAVGRCTVELIDCQTPRTLKKSFLTGPASTAITGLSRGARTSVASCRLAPVLDSLKVSRIFLRSTPGTGIARFRLLKTLQSGEETCAVALSGVCEAVPRI